MKQLRGRPRAFDEEEAVRLAMHYFWEHGYDNASLDKLLPTMGIKKSSFYHTFKSKEELFSRTLDLYREEVLTQMQQLKMELGPKQALLKVLHLTIEELKSTGEVKGCLVVNSGQECYKKYPDLSQQVAVEYRYFSALFTQFIDEGKANGEIHASLASNILASRFLNAMNGLLVTIQAGVDEEMITDIVQSIAEIID